VGFLSVPIKDLKDKAALVDSWILAAACLGWQPAFWPNIASSARTYNTYQLPPNWLFHGTPRTRWHPRSAQVARDKALVRMSCSRGFASPT
jgi:hypothetical protein